MAAQTHPHPLQPVRAPALSASPKATTVAVVPTDRLLVLVPATPMDEAALARQILVLAAPRALPVVYLGLARDAGGEAALRRRLAHLAALTRTDQQSVDTLLATERHWLAAVRVARQPADELVCLAGQMAVSWGRRRPLSVALAAAFRLVVHELEGLELSPVPAVHRRAALGAGVGFIALVAIFFWLQVQAGLLPSGALQGTFLIALVIAEFVLIAAWDQLTR